MVRAAEGKSLDARQRCETRRDSMGARQRRGRGMSNSSWVCRPDAKGNPFRSEVNKPSIGSGLRKSGHRVQNVAWLRSWGWLRETAFSLLQAEIIHQHLHSLLCHVHNLSSKLGIWHVWKILHSWSGQHSGPDGTSSVNVRLQHSSSLRMLPEVSASLLLALFFSTISVWLLAEL